MDDEISKHVRNRTNNLAKEMLKDSPQTLGIAMRAYKVSAQFRQLIYTLCQQYPDNKQDMVDLTLGGLTMDVIMTVAGDIDEALALLKASYEANRADIIKVDGEFNKR